MFAIARLPLASGDLAPLAAKTAERFPPRQAVMVNKRQLDLKPFLVRRSDVSLGQGLLRAGNEIQRLAAREA